MKRLFSILGILGLSVILLTGCSKTVKNTENEKPKNKIKISEYRPEDGELCEENNDYCMHDYGNAIFEVSYNCLDQDTGDLMTTDKVNSLDESHDCVTAIKSFAKYGYTYKEFLENPDAIKVDPADSLDIQESN